jgi:hypothetical protein
LTGNFFGQKIFSKAPFGATFGLNWAISFRKTSRADVMILKIFSLKQIAKKFAFLTHNKAKLCKKIDQNIGF